MQETGRDIQELTNEIKHDIEVNLIIDIILVFIVIPLLTFENITHTKMNRKKATVCAWEHFTY